MSNTTFSEKQLAAALQECEDYQVSTGTGSPSDRQVAEANLAAYASWAIPELVEYARRLEERRQYGADLINDLKLEAEQADAHTKQVEQQLVNVMRAVTQIRQLASGSAPHCINLETIDRLLAGIQLAEAPVVQVFPPACPRCNERPSRCLCTISSHASN
ncbi:hypothetical protein GCM10023185_29910 [Hymenobacter saemangeumensis]|uniref:Uncharacterized protein n=1 Tax=Hymenobacter saemangeumensis TaxID=1084522 RepID=A0ABP8IL85_9BACT